MIKRLGFSFHGFFLGLGIADAVEIFERKKTKEKSNKQNTGP
jgi:hypothetical protein